MSNNTNVAFDGAPVNAPQSENQPAPKKKAYWGARLIALLLAACSVVVPYFFGIFVWTADRTAVKLTFAEMLEQLPNLENKLFGVLPVYGSANIKSWGGLASIAFYCFLLVLAVSLLLGVIALFTRKAPKILKVESIFIAQAYLFYAASVIVIALYNDVFSMEMLDIVSLAIGAVALIVFIVTAIATRKSKAEKAEKPAKAKKEKKEKPAKVKKEKAPKAKAEIAPTPVASAPVAAPVAAPANAQVQVQPTGNYVIEEYAEAMPYDGGPVEGVEMAMEVNPTFELDNLPKQVNTAGYDFYNSKSFDPFIAILNGDERNQFTELFILKCKGVMPEIPDYQVGGDNKEFFRKVFIYLGQYRDRIPDGLLAKIYQFAIKM